MCHHDASQMGSDDTSKRYQVMGFDFIEITTVEWHHMMRITLDRAMTWKVFSYSFHARLFHAPDPGISKTNNSLWIMVECTISNHAANRIGNIEYR